MATVDTTTNTPQKDRNIDIVMCIDGTGSMYPCIDNVKANAKRFQEEFAAKMVELKSNITSLRVKVIVFRDYKDDDDAMEVSPFFELTSGDQADFEAFVNKIDAHGGGDANENGLEALYLAMKSDFFTGPHDRQVIVLFTDADALKLGERSGEANYPADMPDDRLFENTWECVTQDGGKLRNRLKRMVLFAPANTAYSSLASQLTKSYVEPVSMSAGLADIDFSSIIQTIAASAV